MTDTRPTETMSLWGGGDGPSRAPIGLLAPGTALGERYEIRSVLGHGGFAVVYLAYDRELGRDIALKVLREDRLSPGSLSRLKREVRVARDLADPNLVRVFDIESAGSAVFVTLEAVTGGSLRDRMAKGQLAVEQAVALATEIFRGLAALHGVGIVHRDVKPGNVLLTHEGAVKLADFGLALHLQGDDTRVTATETTVGTLEYLAPEQALGEAVDERSDLYSAGVVLFEMLAGRLPHSGRSSLGNLIARFREKPVDITALRPEVPRWLARLLARLLAHERRDRYPSAAAVIHDLERRRVASRPGRKWFLAAAAAAGVALLATATAWWAAEARARGFSHVVSDASGRQVTGVDRRGRTLWRFDDVRAANNFVTVRAAPGQPPLLAATLDSIENPTLDRALFIDLLDPRTGRSVDRIEVQDVAHSTFPNFARTYGVRLAVVDVDANGRQELVASYTHLPYWPSFAAWIETDRRRARVVLIASGHHHFLGAEDLDGDGRAELLFGGVNNRMGWRAGVCAVRVAPSGEGAAPNPALSGDRVPRALLGESLYWYAVGPRRLLNFEENAMRVDASLRRFTLNFWDRSALTLDFQGFPVGSGGGLGARARQAARNAAYLDAAEGARMLEGDRPAGALPFLERAAVDARIAVDRHLEGWVQQLRIEALALAGRRAETERAVDVAAALEPEAASEAAFTAARAWHRMGDPVTADTFYRRAESSTGFSSARPAWETLEGRVLALAELGRFDEARAVVHGYSRYFEGDDRTTRAYEQFLAWRSGGKPEPFRFASDDAALDLHRYWDLEVRALAAEAAESLLALVRSERERSTGTGPLLDSLESELLDRLGHREAAAKRARSALRELDAGLRREVSYRAHRPLLVERLERFERGLAAAGGNVSR